MWEYKIAKTDLGYKVYKKKEHKGMIILLFLSGNDNWITNRTLARTFYHKEDAVSALTLMKVKDGKENAD